ncbi:auxin efflux carrier component 5-like [Nymphaea colorata]|nr:auxin efflux carrier component 5-like [Nymphaea colorata]
MIGGKDVYNVIAATFPLYVPVFLGYGSVRWWKLFTPDQCKGVNRFSVFFIMPFFSFDFVSHINPFDLDCRFLAADVVSKAITVVVLALWAKFTSKGSYSWSITGFSLSALTNTLVVGVPLLHAMYGKVGQDLVIQAFLQQAIGWFIALLFVLELRNATNSFKVSLTVPPHHMGSHIVSMDNKVTKEAEESDESVKEMRTSMWEVIKVVGLKVVVNPNTYASVFGLGWAFLSSRWHFGMPSLMEGSIKILSKCGSGMAMFSIGLFMALQEKLIACGPRLTLLAMVLRFIVGPAVTAISSIVVGLKGVVLCVAIIQAALPQAIASFVYAEEYGLHPEVLSTAVIFGTLVSLPVLIAYYVVLGLFN